MVGCSLGGEVDEVVEGDDEVSAIASDDVRQ
jgi:hypothetical protein